RIATFPEFGIWIHHDSRMNRPAPKTMNVRPHIQLRGPLHVRMAILENDFRFTRRESILVGNTPSQDERAVVEPKISGIPKHYFPDLGFKHYPVVPEHDTKLFRRLSHQLPILEKHLCGGERVGFQNSLHSR